MSLSLNDRNEKFEKNIMYKTHNPQSYFATEVLSILYVIGFLVMCHSTESRKKDLSIYPNV